MTVPSGRRGAPNPTARTSRASQPAAAPFGAAVTSSSIASGTGLYGLRRTGWDRELIQALAIAGEALPQVRDEPSELRATLTRRWPRLAGVPWAPACGDGAAANLGSGCIDATRRALTIGTSSAIRVIVAEPPRRLPPSLWCYRAPAGRFIVGGA